MSVEPQIANQKSQIQPVPLLGRRNPAPETLGVQNTKRLGAYVALYELVATGWPCWHNYCHEVLELDAKPNPSKCRELPTVDRLS